ncbi:hypothetical protein GQW73_005984, partial [Escherichia coli]|nr:hypothetical protein [Escherichia coli]EEQ3833812.1 hypothetical protein [Escherichia coli]EEQ5078370.1 hypothetical protein [Escherichia coli]EEQ5248215.1 hypothetical protein [Escherichia coli]EEQ7484416.1 hypothetical protein [Escherichia coli]
MSVRPLTQLSSATNSTSETL